MSALKEFFKAYPACIVRKQTMRLCAKAWHMMNIITSFSSLIYGQTAGGKERRKLEYGNVGCPRGGTKNRTLLSVV